MQLLLSQTEKANQQRLWLGRCLLLFMLLWQGVLCAHSAQHPIHLQDPADTGCAIHYQQAQPACSVASLVMPEPAATFDGYCDDTVMLRGNSVVSVAIRGPPSYSV